MLEATKGAILKRDKNFQRMHLLWFRSILKTNEQKDKNKIKHLMCITNLQIICNFNYNYYYNYNNIVVIIITNLYQIKIFTVDWCC